MDYPKSKAVALRLVADKFADRAGAVPGSVIPAADWANPITDEIINLQALAGLAATEGGNTQAGLAVQILARGGALGFRVKPQNPLSLSVDIEAGAFFNRTTGLMVTVAATNAGPIVAPGANPRNDIVYIDALTGAAGIKTGAENAAPVDPALPADKIPVKRIRAYVGMTEIAAADLEELRYLHSIGAATSGQVLQVAKTQTGALATGTITIPLDDTIPQNTEGDEYLTLAFTPKSAASRLRIDVLWNGAHTAASKTLIAALFRDAVAAALAVGWQQDTAANHPTQVKLSHDMPSPGIAATTFKVRVGANLAGTTTFNGFSGARQFGGALASSIIITEYKP